MGYFTCGNFVQTWKICRKKLGHFLVWRLPGVLLIFLLFRVLLFLRKSIYSPDISGEDSTKYHFIEVRISPPDGTYIEAACYNHDTSYGDERTDKLVHHEKYLSQGVIKWRVSSGVYFCDALHGKLDDEPSLSTKDFAVFGDGVPQNSSVWVIDYSGRRRIEVDGVKTKDFIGRWFRYPDSD